MQASLGGTGRAPARAAAASAASAAPRPPSISSSTARLIAAASGNGGGPKPQPQPSSSGSSGNTSGNSSSAPPLPPSSLDLPRESAAPLSAPAAPKPAAATPSVSASPQRAVKTTGLRRAPLSGGVKTATARYDLPSPAVAVRNLVEQARFAHLCTVMSHMHHRRAGYPFGTLVDFAVDGAGMPLFCLSPLAIHARNLIEDPRASLVVQMPGWTGLANARVTIFGDVYPLPPDMQDDAREIFLAKQQATGGSGSASSVSRRDRWVLGSFTFFRMHRIVDVYFVGGFGTVQWIEADEYVGSSPDPIATDAPQRTLQVLNEVLGAELRDSLGVSLSSLDGGGVGGGGGGVGSGSFGEADLSPPPPYDAAADRWALAADATPEAAWPPGAGGADSGAALAGGLVGIDDAAFISIDALGTDVRVRHGSDFSVERIGFDQRAHTLDEAVAAVRASLVRARREQAEAAEEALAKLRRLREEREAAKRVMGAAGQQKGQAPR